MKLIALVSALALTAAACGGGGTGGQTAATTAPAAATTAPAATVAATARTSFAFTAELRSTNEVPPIANAESTCTGTATVTLNRAANNGVFQVQVSGCPASAEPTIMHIHRGAAGANGGVVVNSGLVAGEWTLTAGAGSITKNIATIDAALLGEIIASPAGFYYNVHSKVNPGGVIRGQLTLRP